MCCCESVGREMGLGAGGRMRQLIYADEHGIGTWDETSTGRVYVHIVNSMTYREITGEEPPATPVSARDYARHGLPWFDLYDDGKADLPASKALKGVKSIKQLDAERGFAQQQDDAPVVVPDDQVKTLGKVVDGSRVPDGKW